MYWLGFFITVISLGVSGLVGLKQSDANIKGNEIFVYVLGVIAIIVLSALWPLTWMAFLCAIAIFVIYNFVMKRIAKYEKGKNTNE